MYFLFFILHGWRKRSAVQPQTICSEIPLCLFSENTKVHRQNLQQHPRNGSKTEGYPAWRMGLAPQLVFVFIAACKSTSPRFIWLCLSEIYLKLPSLDSSGLFFGKGQIFLEIFTVCYAIFISHKHPLTVF